MKCFILVGMVAVAVSGQRVADSKHCKKPDGLFPHDQYCDYYYDCQDGEAVLQACPNGLAFAGKKKGLLENCDYPHKVGCPDEDSRVMGQTPESSENCHWKYGIFAHATSCTRYWQCWNSTATNQQCPFSLLYNDAAHACDWPDNVPDCQKHPICKDVANGPIPIEKSCARYWLCVGGYPRLQRCSAGLAFNPDTLKCELDHTVPGCEPPPSDVESDEEERSGPKQNPRLQSPPPRSQSPPPRLQPAPQTRPVARPIQQIVQRPLPPSPQVVPALLPPSQPAFRPEPAVQQFRPQSVAQQTETPEYEYEDDETTEAPTTQRPRRRPTQFGK
ncbi:protein obstructor-E-like isoform X1 [Varroa jacobsoni]|uniref:protein obstructor-E-like isoform X1 n=1 Tax=Varroa jacobsoni TaxID=62625 RepID=UPI000BF2CD7E|nr:protein obstructor-E-like isoform X1 [Varroa jacobsoni]